MRCAPGHHIRGVPRIFFEVGGLRQEFFRGGGGEFNKFS
jgi:hypothetical protein